MNIILYGPPGAGKGTQSDLLKKDRGYLKIATGDLLRHEVAQGTELGLRCKELMDKGQLVPDHVIIELVDSFIKREPSTAGYIFDGFPRSIPQAEALDNFLAQKRSRVEAVINIVVDEECLVDRITNRVSCSACQASFNKNTHPPKVEGVCDNCGAKALFTRKDDTYEVFVQRLKVYNEQTKPLIEYYTKKGILHSVDGMQEVEKVAKQIHAILAKVVQS